MGKSTLFNLLFGRRKALVEGTPGLTRDRNYAEVTVRDKYFVVVDTGGFEPTSPDVMLSQMRTQTMVAIEQSDIIVFLGDAKIGITPSDHEIVRLLQKTDKKVFYVVNKIDSEKQEPFASDFYALGVDPLFSLSAMTGYGVSEFIDALVADIPEEGRVAMRRREEDEEPAEPMIKVAVVGRPNVGKSTLINLLLGEERLVANPKPGTTRDSIDTVVKYYGKEYLFIDTAGIRRRSRIVDLVEKYSVIKAFGSIDRAEIVLVIMDATEPVTDQDVRIAGYAFEKARGVILLLNKWDLVPKDSTTVNKFYDQVRQGLKYLHYAPIMTLSALTGHASGETLPAHRRNGSSVPKAHIHGRTQQVPGNHGRAESSRNAPQDETHQDLLSHPGTGCAPDLYVFLQLSRIDPLFLQEVPRESDQRGF